MDRDQARDLGVELPSRRRQDIGDWLSGRIAASDRAGDDVSESVTTRAHGRSAASGCWLRRLLPGWIDGTGRARRIARTGAGHTDTAAIDPDEGNESLASDPTGCR